MRMIREFLGTPSESPDVFNATNHARLLNLTLRRGLKMGRRKGGRKGKRKTVEINTTPKDLINIIRMAKQEVFNDIEKENIAIGYIKLTGGFYLKLREKHSGGG